MLLELRAENYAVIDHAVAVFGPGLNLLTGETGAGKSILVDALALLMGDKASSDMVRHGADRAVVACVFESTAGAEAALEANGLDGDGEEVILRREILPNGKGRVYVNNQPATVTVLRQLAPELALIHAQSETLGAFDAAQQRGLLDRFAGISADGELATAVSAAFANWREISTRLDDLERDEQDRLRAADLWSFQNKEIAGVRPVAGEDEALENERRILANAEKLYAAAMSAYELLYEGSSSAEGNLRAAEKHLDELARFDHKFVETAEQLASARAVVEDVGATVRDYAESIQASPERLAEIEDRLALLERLKRKYGSTLSEVIAYGEEVSAKLAEIENRDEVLKSLKADLLRAAERYCSAAASLSKERIAAAKRLEKLAEHQINDLAMKVKFAVGVASRQEETFWTSHGWDTVECRIATNAGEPLKPLDEIASGGEMSRVLLALKVSVEEGANLAASHASAKGGKKKTAAPRTLVFDEIDIGIGGRAAEAVGQKLKELSRAQQILCVTHLPQIAAFADQHFLIEKREHQGRTKTAIRLMDESERTQEIARMLSGAAVTETSVKHAEQLLRGSR
ncbi:DNA repair protein RecN [Acidisarcina polymorpha]|uniref:DNA repair protein RecN n=1 Tax=Acidisarcina polymorpha TaxID=2211140 RepID=A0A2Z5FUR7_9BACT|nr:DNA repair protein RecN [Acidisarcina polymorpha]AXC10623.1 DNA repair protein RecN [Acidisarcina polymorpha]